MQEIKNELISRGRANGRGKRLWKILKARISKMKIEQNIDLLRGKDRYSEMQYEMRYGEEGRKSYQGNNKSQS